MDRSRQVKLAFEQLNQSEQTLVLLGNFPEIRETQLDMRENVIKAFGMHAQGVTTRQLTKSAPVWTAFNRLADAEQELRDHKGDRAAQLFQKVREARDYVETRIILVLKTTGTRGLGVQPRVPEAIPSSSKGAGAAPPPKIPAIPAHPGEKKRPRPDAGGGEQASDQKKPAGSGGFVDLSQDSD